MSSQLRILSGQFRGIKLVAPSGLSTRPSKALVRAAVMNMLQIDLDNSVFWDLFAGTGAIGLEAFSRGAKTVVFFEENKTAIACIKQNIETICKHASKQQLPLPDLNLVTLSLENIRDFGPYPNPDFVWLDPPYSAISTLVSLCNRLLAKQAHASFIIETSADVSPSQLESAGLDAKFKLYKTKLYGQTAVHWYRVVKG